MKPGLPRTVLTKLTFAFLRTLEVAGAVEEAIRIGGPAALNEWRHLHRENNRLRDALRRDEAAARAMDAVS